MLRPRPRPIKQHQDYITKKTLLLQHTCLLSKNNFVQKRQKVIWWPVTFGTVSALIARKNTGVYYTAALSCHTVPVRHTSVGSKTKSIRPRPNLQDQDQDLGRSETSLVIRPRSQTPRLSEIWGFLPQKNLAAQKHQNFGEISDFTTWSRISPNGNKISSIRKRYRKLQSLPYAPIKFGELWSTNGEK